MEKLIKKEDDNNFTLILQYPNKTYNSIKYNTESEKDIIKVPLKSAGHLESCKEVCPLRNKCEGTLDRMCDEIFLGHANLYFNIQEEDYSTLYGIIKKIYFFPKLGILNKRKRIFKKEKE